MAASSYKRKSPVLFFVAVFSLIVLVMLAVNSRSLVKHEFNAPAGGIERLYTAGGVLIAVSKTNEVWVWDWTSLADGPRVRSVKSSNALWLPGDRLILAPSDSLGMIVVSNFINGTDNKQLVFDSGWQCEHLGIGGGGRFVALALVDKAGQGQNSSNSKRFRLEMLSPGLDKLIPVTTIEKEDDTLILYELDVSDDGVFIAAVGQTNDFAWIGVFNVAQRKIVWEKVVETSSEFTDVAFSPNGQLIYAGGEGACMYAFETTSGKQVGQFLMDQARQTASFNEQRVTCTEVSPDGFVVAAGVNPGNKVYFWDTTTGKRLGVMGGCRGLNNLAFSPDSSTFVVAGRNYGGSLKVRRVPKK